MDSEQTQRLIITSLTQKCYINVLPHHSLADVRISIHETWDEDQYPCPFNFKVDNILISIKQERDHLALDIMERGVEVKLFQKKSDGAESSAMSTAKKRRNNTSPTKETTRYPPPREMLDVECDVIIAPPHAREYKNGEWICTAKSPHQQYICKAVGCKRQVRTCCACSMGYWLCTKHIVCHVANKAQSRSR
jgi:hypothetical protein